MKLTGSQFLRWYVTGEENAAKIQATVADHGPIRLDDLIAETGLGANPVLSTVLWLAKFDCVQIQS